MRWMLAILTATMFLPGALANDDAWTLHAQSDISASSERGLTEFYVPLALQESPAPVSYTHLTLPTSVIV